MTEIDLVYIEIEQRKMDRIQMSLETGDITVLDGVMDAPLKVHCQCGKVFDSFLELANHLSQGKE